MSASIKREREESVERRCSVTIYREYGVVQRSQRGTGPRRAVQRVMVAGIDRTARQRVGVQVRAETQPWRAAQQYEIRHR